MRGRIALGDRLNLNVEMINDEHEEANKIGFSMGDTTYRHDGFSIGQDFLRLEGRTVTRGELLPSSLSLKEMIGEGAFSKVHKGIWNRKNPSGENEKTEVAVKQFCLIDSSPQRRDMLMKELKALCKMKSDCLVQFEGAFLHEDTVTMVLEFMDRGSLEHWLKPSSQIDLNEPLIAPIAFQMLFGLAYLHKERIIHRDIKPGNVLIHSNGGVKLCDFGLASLSDQSLHTTLVGTTRYMAPERLRGQPYGRKSDLWSLGLVILECFTKKIPWYESDSLVSLVVTVEEASINDIIPSDLSSDVREFLKFCLQHKSEKRVPAEFLMKSPWLVSIHQITSLADAQSKVKYS